MTHSMVARIERGPRRARIAKGLLLGGFCLAGASNVAPERSAAQPDPRAPLATVPAKLVPSRKVVEAMGSRRLLEIPRQTALAINEARPINPGGLEVAPPYRFSGDAASRSRAVDCLAAAALYEAGDDPLGQRSVMQVVLNRARHPAYRSSVCGVVFQGSDRATGCQFTFTCDGALARTPPAPAWDRARKLAGAALDGAVFGEVGAATHYHTDWVVPVWGPRLDKIAKVRTHIFYRFPGSYGRKAALGAPIAVAEPFVRSLARLSPAHLAAADPGAVLIGASAIIIGPGASAAASGPARVLMPPGVFDLDLAEVDQPGRWAMKSLGLCGPSGPCLVVGRSGRFPASQAPLFVFRRDGAGMTVALWDCSRVARPDPSQCLPEGSSELERLMRRPVSG